MATQIIELTGDEQRLLRSLQRVITAEEKHQQKLEQTERIGRQAGEGIAGAMVTAEETISNRFSELGKELASLGPEGKIAAKQLQLHLRESGKDGKRSIGEIVKEIRKLDPAAAEAASVMEAEVIDANESIAESQEETFGAGAIGKIAKYAAGFATITAAVDLVKEAFAFMAEERGKALDSLLETTNPEQRLLQVSKNAGDFEYLQKVSDDLSTEFGVERDAAKELVFSARSENFEDALPFIGRNAPVIPVSAQATVAGQVPGLFVNEEVTPQEAINATLVAAEKSRLDFSQIARALPAAAEGGAIAGASFNETTAALSVLAGRFKSGETAADRIKALSTAVGLNSDFEGLGLIESVEKLATLNDQELADVIGKDQEKNAAFRILLEELDTVKQREREIADARAATGTDQEITSQKLKIVDANPRLAARREIAKAEQIREVAREDRFAVDEAGRETASLIAQSQLDKDGATGIQKFAADRAAFVSSQIGLGGSATGDLIAEASDQASASNVIANAVPLGAAMKGGFDLLGGLLSKVVENTSSGLPDPSRAQRAAIAEVTQ